ncbi:hypothetical protein FHP24_14785 [Aliirhizobium smilacinae]|uniref:Uncharacterized protein n=1 Tax=Aliirhizobium smilacinae TaxID=1395944 RepID=A0A5C4XGE4_9HYPH|nr:hypothetical protein FHP24_14785 [Rhizobium smilacinae]
MLVTGIQPRRVCAVKECIKSLAPKDLGALDSCDKPEFYSGHRNEGYGDLWPARPCRNRI